MFLLLVALMAQANPPAELAPAPSEREAPTFTLADGLTLEAIKSSPKGKVVGTCGAGKTAKDVRCTHVKGSDLACTVGDSKPKEHTWIGGTDPFRTECDYSTDSNGHTNWN